ncbi:hypothetical protein EVAR_9082_1 [Eumeta japonica]|uniref:Uncharacterized protein n=1 Tax=Eumeta variegata TaxID=151549 RepID=A0A4C1TW63_EUMVA|nr:hypothetical protein EVAR_9082_1 [Eumeta japonica]
MRPGGRRAAIKDCVPPVTLIVVNRPIIMKAMAAASRRRMKRQFRPHKQPVHLPCRLPPHSRPRAPYPQLQPLASIKFGLHTNKMAGF